MNLATTNLPSMWESLKKMIKTFKIEYGSRFEEGRELPWDPTSRLDLRHVLLSLFPLRSREQGMGLCAARSCPKASSIRLRKDRGGNAFRQSFLMESLSMALPRSAMGEGFHRVEEEVAPSPLDPNGRYEDESLPAACMFVFGIDELKDSLEGHAGDARVHRERAVPTIFGKESVVI